MLLFLSILSFTNEVFARISQTCLLYASVRFAGVKAFLVQRLLLIIPRVSVLETRHQYIFTTLPQVCQGLVARRQLIAAVAMEVCFWVFPDSFPSHADSRDDIQNFDGP